MVDKDGGLRSDTVDVVVDNVAPTATLADVTAVEGTTATIAFTGADDVSAADKAAGFTFEWDADGDGTFDKGAGSIAVPAPDGPLTKTIKGAILDRDGGRHEYTTTLTVTNAAPTAVISGPDAVPSSGADRAHARHRRRRRRHRHLRPGLGRRHHRDDHRHRREGRRPRLHVVRREDHHARRHRLRRRHERRRPRTP